MNITQRLEEQNLKYAQQELERMAMIRAIPSHLDDSSFARRVMYILHGFPPPAELSPWLLK